LDANVLIILLISNDPLFLFNKNIAMLKALDIFFTVFHTALILFNLFGWMSNKTAMANFITLSLTLLSWTVLGIFYGFGYCPFTEWHWQVLRQLGYQDLPLSYIQFLVHRITGYTPPEKLTDILTVVGLLMAFTLSIYVNFIKKRKS